MQFPPVLVDISTWNFRSRLALYIGYLLQFLVFMILTPLLLEKQNWMKKFKKNPLFLPSDLTCRIIYLYSMFLLQMIHCCVQYVYFIFIYFRTWWNYFWGFLLFLLLNFFVFSMKFVSLLHRYFTSYPSQTFAVRKT